MKRRILLRIIVAVSPTRLQLLTYFILRTLNFDREEPSKYFVVF